MKLLNDFNNAISKIQDVASEYWIHCVIGLTLIFGFIIYQVMKS